MKQGIKLRVANLTALIICGPLISVFLKIAMAKITKVKSRKISGNKLPDFKLRVRGWTLGIDSFLFYIIMFYLFKQFAKGKWDAKVQFSS